MRILATLTLLLFVASTTHAEDSANSAEKPAIKKNTKVKYRKKQEVNFEEQDIDGLARTPTGSYLVQKRGVDFAPLFKVRERFDESIKDSIEYLR
ncbi:MAG: hypothetical protein KDD37_06110 [Bdellovibrionales bacterium]|nr:hypothetical protein [Bdellovibrionales bacterium]